MLKLQKNDDKNDKRRLKLYKKRMMIEHTDEYLNYTKKEELMNVARCYGRVDEVYRFLKSQVELKAIRYLRVSDVHRLINFKFGYSQCINDFN